jgi:DNA (cytosine-5)-methyltransferase 3A
MNILSLFDGISCARVAFEKYKIPVTTYRASEIDEVAIKISKQNFPDIIRLGNVQNISKDMIDSKIDFLIGGSPCQNLSACNFTSQNGLQGIKSSLFYEYVRLLELFNPKYFIFENVSSMKKEEKEKITDILQVEAVKLDAKFVSAQTRSRLFWTNIPVMSDPKDKGLILRDIQDLEGPFTFTTDRIKAKKIGTLAYEKAHKNTRSLDQKVKCLTANGHGISNTGATNVLLDNGNYRNLTPLECERCQGLPDGYTKGYSDRQRYKVIGNGFNVDIIGHILKSL